MKTERIDVRSIVTHRKSRLGVAACLILAAFALPLPEVARATGGGPPQPVDTTPFLLPASVSGCDFDILAQFPTGKSGLIILPGGFSFININPETSLKLTNANDPTRTVTFQGFTGVGRLSYDQNGNLVILVTGRNAFYGPPFGLLFMIGQFTVVVDPNTFQLLEPPTGTGQIIDLCALLE